MATPLKSALEKLLGEDDTLEAFVRTRRAEGTSWRQISVDLHNATGVLVTHESLRAWFPDDVEASA